MAGNDHTLYAKGISDQHMKLPVQHLVVPILGFFLGLLVGGDQKYQLMIANRVSKVHL